MWGRAAQLATKRLGDDVEAFRAAGYRAHGRHEPRSVKLEGAGRPSLILRMVRSGRVFGGTYALEIESADPVLPVSGGLRVRGRGIVTLSGLRFRAHRHDRVGASLGAALEAEGALAEAVRAVHFERIRVDPSGRVAIRHMGGSVVWMLFPPVVRPIPLTGEQVRASLDAIEAFAAAGRRLDRNAFGTKP